MFCFVLFKLVIDNVELLDNEFKLVNIVVDVLFKLVIDNVELLDNEFKLVNIVVDVLFKLVIDNVELLDNEFKLVVNAYTGTTLVAPVINVDVDCVESSIVKIKPDIAAIL